MNTHAVPQEIMSVDFKLFGNFLSLREFIFIAVGLALAWFFWFLMKQGVIPGIFAVPISFILGGGGILTGLVPINDRSLDKWILDYFSAIKKPTRRVWKKLGYQNNIASAAPDVSIKDQIVAPVGQTQGVFVSAPLTSLAPAKVDVSTITVERAELSDLQSIEQSFSELSETTSEVPVTTTISSTSPVSSTSTSNMSIPEIPAAEMTTLPIQNESPVVPGRASAPTVISGSVELAPRTISSPVTQSPSQTAVSPQTQFSDGQFPPGVTVIPANQQGTPLVNSQPVPQPLQPQEPPKPAPAPEESHTKVIVIDDNKIKDYATTLPGLEEKTNTINIVVKDANGLIMPGVVCVIKNAHGDPVRAAISNILGQIINNIPLKDGMYKISLTKQGYTFPEVTRTMTGKVYPPIEIKSL